MIQKETYSKYLSALLEGNRNYCRQTVTTLLDENINLKVLYEELFRNSLYEVGRLWEQNKISVAVEHLATSITEHLMTLVYPRLFEAEHSGQKAVVSAATNEYHQVGARMVADIFELNGWDGYFLGANTPENELLDFIGEKSPDVLALSVSIFFNMNQVVSLIDSVNDEFPKLPVLVGGQAFLWGNHDIEEKYPNVTYLKGLSELEKFLQQNNQENGIRFSDN